jgi:hypothetical protein
MPTYETSLGAVFGHNSENFHIGNLYFSCLNLSVKYCFCYNFRYTDEEVCQYLLRHSVLYHLDSDKEKFDLLVFMARKLFAFAHGKCALEGMDPVMMQEITLPGHLYLQLLKDRLSSWLTVLKYVIMKRERVAKNFVFNQSKLIGFLLTT